MSDDFQHCPKPKKRRGFAVMSPERVKEIARLGGRAAHIAGTAHEFTSAEAAIAGAKGGRTTYARKLARKLAEECSAGALPEPNDA